MKIGIVGVAHNNAPIDIREKIAFTTSKKIEFSSMLLEIGIEETVILSTCNRIEIYYVIDKEIENINEILVGLLEEFFTVEKLVKYIYTIEGSNAIKHVFSVSCGLESIVLGEDQILGQIKDAHDFSMEKNFSGKNLNKVFREAITFSKKMRTKYKISENSLSVSSMAVKHIKNELGSLVGKKVMVIGVGDMGKLLLKYLSEEDIENIYLTTRSGMTSVKHKITFSSIENAVSIEYGDRYNAIDEMDVLFTATASPHLIVEKKHMLKRKKPLYIFDISVPRDVEYSIGALENVKLFDVDDLNNIVKDNMAYREKIAKEINKCLELEACSVESWFKSSIADNTLKQINNLCKKTSMDMLESIYKRIDLDEKERKHMEKIVTSNIKKIMKNPIIELKSINDADELLKYNQVMSKLFNFEEV